MVRILNSATGFLHLLLYRLDQLVQFQLLKIVSFFALPKQFQFANIELIGRNNAVAIDERVLFEYCILKNFLNLVAINKLVLKQLLIDFSILQALQVIDIETHSIILRLLRLLHFEPHHGALPLYRTE